MWEKKNKNNIDSSFAEESINETASEAPLSCRDLLYVVYKFCMNDSEISPESLESCQVWLNKLSRINVQWSEAKISHHVILSIKQELVVNWEYGLTA